MPTDSLFSTFGIDFDLPDFELPWYVRGFWDMFQGDIIAMLLALVVLWLVVLVLAWLFIVWRDKHARDLVFLKISLPRADSQLDDQKRTQKDFKEKTALMSQIYRNIWETRSLTGYDALWKSWFWKSNTFSMELLLRGRELHFFIVCDKYYADMISKQITSVYTSADISVEPSYRVFDPNKRYRGITMGLHRQQFKPIKTFKYLEDDSLNIVGNVLSKLDEGEEAAIQLVMRPIRSGWQQEGLAHANELFKGRITGANNEEKQGMFSRLFGKKQEVKDSLRVLSSDEEAAKRIAEKCTQVGFACAVRVVVSSPDNHRTEDILRGIELGFNAFSDVNVNELKSGRIVAWDALNSPLIDFGFRHRLLRFFNPHLTLSPDELATIFHLPDSRFNSIPVINWLSYKVLPAPVNLPTSGNLLGRNVHQGVVKDVRIMDEDRKRHVYIIGKSGSGKSVLLNNMAVQDAQDGKGLGMIDPHGDLIDDTLAAIPKERAKDVIIFDAADRERPVGLNILEAYTAEEQERAASDATEIFIKIYGDEIFGPRIQHYFRNACLTLMEDQVEGATLIDIPRVFTDDAFNKRKVAQVKNSVVRSFWENEYAKTGQREKEEMVPYFSAKFGPFITDTTIRNIIGQPKSGINIRKAMDEGKILLFNLSKGEVGALNAQLLGLILVTKINMAAMARQSMDKKDRRDFFCYVDEFQNFATDTFAEILSEARKYGLGMIMAHQFIDQLTVTPTGKQDTRVRDAVFGNVGTMISFKIGARDAEYLQKEYEPVLSSADIVGIANFKAYLKLNINNATSRPFSMNTIYYPGRGNKKVAGIIREMSRLTYGRDKKFVDEEIEMRIGIRGKPNPAAAPAEDVG